MDIWLAFLGKCPGGTPFFRPSSSSPPPSWQTSEVSASEALLFSPRLLGFSETLAASGRKKHRTTCSELGSRIQTWAIVLDNYVWHSNSFRLSQLATLSENWFHFNPKQRLGEFNLFRHLGVSFWSGHFFVASGTPKKKAALDLVCNTQWSYILRA